MGTVKGADVAKGAALGTAVAPGWGTVIGAGAGAVYDWLSSDPAPAPAPPPPAVAPVLDQRAGLGSAWGGYQTMPTSPTTTGYAQQASDLQQSITTEQQAIADLEKQKLAVLAQFGGIANPQSQADADKNRAIWDAHPEMQSQMNDLNAQEATHQQALSTAQDSFGKVQQQYQASAAEDQGDAARFSAQAAASYNRQAPQAQVVGVDQSQAQQQLAQQEQSRQQLGSDIGTMRGMTADQNQQALVNRLNSDLQGKAPSLAQAQLNQTTQENIAAQHAMAASAGPMDYAAAQRAAIMAGANTQQQAVGQAAMLRAQEYQASEGMLGNVAGQMRGQSIGAQQNVLQASITQRAQDLQNLGLSYQDALARANFEAQQNQFNVGQQAQQNQLNQSREQFYLGAYQNYRGLQQQNATAQLNANVATNTSNTSAGAANYATASNVALQNAAANRQQTNDIIGGISAGAAAYNSANNSPNKTAPTTAPTAPKLTNDNPDLGY